MEKTQALVQGVTEVIKAQLPDNAVNLTSAYVGLQPPGNPINPIFLFTNASHEAVLQVSVNQGIYKGSVEALKERIRIALTAKFPDAQFNYEPMELTEKIMGQGAMTPVPVEEVQP